MDFSAYLHHHQRQQQLQQQQQQQQQQLQHQQQLQQQQRPQLPPRPLQGPRPAPLKVRKDSYKIKKPPTVPDPSQATAAAPQQYRQPVIIYTVSPKVIRTKPSEFMSLVQRLTGINSSPSAAAAAAAASSPSACLSPSGALSPAARLATIEKAQHASDHTPKPRPSADDLNIIDQFDASGGVAAALDRSTNFMGILSPNPASLPVIQPNFFSAPPELNSLGFLHDMISPTMPVNRHFVDNFLTSPTFPFTPTAPSPNWDLFNAFQDL